MILQVFNFFKKYQEEHYKKFPPKTEELKKKWNEYNEQQKKLAEIKKQNAEMKSEEGTSEAKITEIKNTDNGEEEKKGDDKEEVKQSVASAASPV